MKENFLVDIAINNIDKWAIKMLKCQSEKSIKKTFH